MEQTKVQSTAVKQRSEGRSSEKASSGALKNAVIRVRAWLASEFLNYGILLCSKDFRWIIRWERNTTLSFLDTEFGYP